MAANQVASIACAPNPEHPTWEELAANLKRDCNQSVLTPVRTFDDIYVRDHAGNMKPHTVCRFSAKCPRTLQFLAGITSFKHTRTIYIIKLGSTKSDRPGMYLKGCSASSFAFTQVSAAMHSWGQHIHQQQ